MGLVGINQGTNPIPRRNQLEQIATGVQMAANIVGTGLNAYKVFGIDKPELELQQQKAAGEEGLQKAHTAYFNALAGNPAATAQLDSDGNPLPPTPGILQQRVDAQKLMHQQVTANQATKTQDQAFFKAQSDLESLRGNTAIRNAQEVLRLAGNARAILAPYGDQLNQVPNDQVNLFDTEMAKIATGGVPSEAELHQIQDPTLYKQFTGLVSKIKNAPQGAGQAQFLPNKLRYLNDLQENAKSLIDSNYNRKLDNWKTKLNPNDYANLKQNMQTFLSGFQQTPVINTPSGQAALAPSGPKVGEVDAGADGIKHRFKGGDPSNPASWEPIQ